MSTPVEPFPASDAERVALRAVLDRLIPRDAWPGALDAGADRYVVHQLNHVLAARRPEVSAGLAALDTAAAGESAPRSFAHLPADRQDALLRACEREPWFDLLVNLAAEGFYADPGNGGNDDAVSWRMIGYAPGRFSFRPPAPALPPRRA